MRWIILSLALGCSTNGTPTPDAAADSAGAELQRVTDGAAQEAQGEAIAPAEAPPDAGAPDAAKEKPADVRPESKCSSATDDGGCRQWCLCDDEACGGSVVPYCGEQCAARC